MTGGYLYVNGSEIKNNTKVEITAHSGTSTCKMNLNITLEKNKIYKKK
jgi:hypothetical protein